MEFPPTRNTLNNRHRLGGRSGKIRLLFQSGAAHPEEDSLSLRTPRGACPIAELHCAIWKSQKLQLADEYRASLPWSASFPHTITRVQQPSNPSEKSVRHVVRRTFSISKSMASSSSSSPTSPTVRPPRTPRPPAPPSLATASPHLIASPPRLLWQGTSGKRVPSGQRETLAPDPPDGQGPGSAFALRGARHKVCTERFGWFASSPNNRAPPLSFTQPDPYRCYNRVLEGSEGLAEGAGAERLGRGSGAGGRDLALATRPRRWRRVRRAAPTAASTVQGSSAARSASKPRTAGLHARTRIGSATRRHARRRCLCRTSPRKSTRHMQQGTGGGFCSGRGAWQS